MDPATRGPLPATRPARSVRIGVACAIAGAVTFSGKAILVKLIYGHGVDATTTFALRMMMALPFFVLLGMLAGSRGLARYTARDWVGIAGCGFLGFYFASYLDFLSLQYITAGLERLLLFLYPTMVVLLSAALHRQRVTARQRVSLVLSYTGVACVAWQNLGLAGSTGTVLLGAGLALASAFSYACYVVVSAGVVARIGTVRFTSYASSTACGFAIAHFFATHGPSALLVPLPVYGLALAMAVFCTVLPILLTAEALRRVGANQVALLGAVGPVATILLAYAVLGEPLTALQAAGGLLAIAGVLLVSVRPAARGR